MAELENAGTDITVFDDFGAVAKNERLKRYVADTRAPLRDHAATVVRLANERAFQAD